MRQCWEADPPTAWLLYSFLCPLVGPNWGGSLQSMYNHVTCIIRDNEGSKSRWRGVQQSQRPQADVPPSNSRQCTTWAQQASRTGGSLAAAWGVVTTQQSHATAHRPSQAGVAVEAAVLEPQCCNVVVPACLGVRQHAVRLAQQLEDGVGGLGAQPCCARRFVGMEHLAGREADNGWAGW